MERFEQAAQLLPQRLRLCAMKLSSQQRGFAEELRLRIGTPMQVVTPWGELTVDERQENVVVEEDLQGIFHKAAQYSAYTVTETIAQGYLTTQGGFRIGLCGSAVVKDGRVTGMRQFSSMAIRISREKNGLALPLLPQLLEEGRFFSTLLLSDPGGGKTTLLRDMVRCLSDGDIPHRMALVDERGEIAAACRGVPQMNVGSHTDVLSGCPKAEGIYMLLRTMNPEIIALDEITSQEDLKAVCQSANCGVPLLATIHARNCLELRQKPLFQQLLAEKVFRRAVVIGRHDGERSYRVEELGE